MDGLLNSRTLTIPALSGTFGIPARLTLNLKIPKEPSSPFRYNARQRDSATKINRLDIELKNGQLVTCGHTQYGGSSVFQRLWLVSAFLHLDKEVASKSRTAHTAVRYGALERITLRCRHHGRYDYEIRITPKF